MGIEHIFSDHCRVREAELGEFPSVHHFRQLYIGGGGGGGGGDKAERRGLGTGLGGETWGQG